MTGGELLARLGAAQRTRRFKIVATVVISALAIVGAVAWTIAVNAPDSAEAVRGAVERAAEAQARLGEARQAAGAAETRALLDASNPALAGALAIGAGAAVALIAVWLGVALTYLALGLIAAAVAAPLILFEPTRAWGRLLLGALALTASFTAILQALRAAFSAGAAVPAIARNVLSEAVRMKISLVFIVMLIVLMAGLPLFLDDEQPLRYRVQLFMQWGTGGAFWLLALLTVFFSTATVAFEQRDRIIWQTMTKPVSPLQYLLGKWIGVMALNAALLAVTASGVFLFTEALRNTPAQGEIRPYVSEDGSAAPTNDRRLLESEVLSARASRSFERPEFEEEDLRVAVDERIEEIRRTDPDFQPTREIRAALRAELIDLLRQRARTIEASPNAYADFVFTGLARAREMNAPVTLRYTINAASNNPSALYRMLFLVGNQHAFERQVPLATASTLAIPPDAIGDDGALTVRVYNGDPRTGQTNRFSAEVPPDGMEVLYRVGSYEPNFLRVTLVLWLKLAFIAALGVMTSSFLSFPVASLVTMFVFLIAESSGYMVQSLSWYVSQTKEGIDWVAVAARAVAVPVTHAFRWYGELRPTPRLVDGRVVPWSTVIAAALSLTAASGVTLALGWAVFRRRELATYSGK